MDTSTFQKILVPVDLTPQSLETAVYASSLAQRLSAQLLFLHVARVQWPLDHDQIEVRDAVLNLCARSDRMLFRRGAPARVIVETAQAEQVDLILIASRKKPFLTRLFDGSVTAHVLRHAPCPVWATLHELLPLSLQPIRTVVCEDGGPVLDFALTLGELLNARVFIHQENRVVELTPVHCGVRSSTAVLPDPVDIDEPDLVVMPKQSGPKLFADVRSEAYQRALRLRHPVACL
ncbi:MAG: universal stress protein [Bryobacterales bacterium]|nr:universal stress protein [Bryobacterales bacterium]